jgi:hypothetical protein
MENFKRELTVFLIFPRWVFLKFRQFSLNKSLPSCSSPQQHCGSSDGSRDFLGHRRRRLSRNYRRSRKVKAPYNRERKSKLPLGKSRARGAKVC